MKFRSIAAFVVLVFTPLMLCGCTLGELTQAQKYADVTATTVDGVSAVNTEAITRLEAIENALTSNADQFQVRSALGEVLDVMRETQGTLDQLKPIADKAVQDLEAGHDGIDVAENTALSINQVIGHPASGAVGLAIVAAGAVAREVQNRKKRSESNDAVSSLSRIAANLVEGFDKLEVLDDEARSVLKTVQTGETRAFVRGVQGKSSSNALANHARVVAAQTAAS